MPFSKTTDDHTKEYWDRHFKEYLKPLIEENTIVEARRSQPLRGDIVREIIKYLYVSPIVLADLTDSNANVYWELGVRQSFKPGTITIADDGYRQKIPFNIGAEAIHFYFPNNAHQDALFRIDLKGAIQDCLVNPHRTDSAVLETVTGRGTLYEIVHREESARRLTSLLWELDRNEITYQDAIKTAKKNLPLREQKKENETVIPTDRFFLMSTELLMTHRYVDEPEAIYESARSYYAHWLAMRDQMNVWETSQRSTESWFLDDESQKSRQRVLDKFRSYAKAARERLLSLP